MEKYESLITRVVFQYNGIYTYNRQQLCDFTSNDLTSNFFLRVGETFRHEGNELRITHIHFSMLDEWYSSLKKIDVFTEFDNNPVNCEVIVYVEKV